MSSRLGDCFLKRMGKTAGTTVTPLSPSKLINQGDFGAFRGRSCCCCWGRSGAVMVQHASGCALHPARTLCFYAIFIFSVLPDSWPSPVSHTVVDSS